MLQVWKIGLDLLNVTSRSIIIHAMASAWQYCTCKGGEVSICMRRKHELMLAYECC